MPDYLLLFYYIVYFIIIHIKLYKIKLYEYKERIRVYAQGLTNDNGVNGEQIYE